MQIRLFFRSSCLWWLNSLPLECTARFIPTRRNYFRRACGALPSDYAPPAAGSEASSHLSWPTRYIILHPIYLKNWTCFTQCLNSLEGESIHRCLTSFLPSSTSSWDFWAFAYPRPTTFTFRKLFKMPLILKSIFFKSKFDLWWEKDKGRLFLQAHPVFWPF